MDPLKWFELWTIANWWRIPIPIVISKMEGVWIMVYQKITVKMVVGFRGSRPMPFRIFQGPNSENRWVTVLGCQAVNQRPCHTRESVVPGELAGQLSRQELDVEPRIWIDGLPMFTSLPPIDGEIGVGGSYYFTNIKWFHHNLSMTWGRFSMYMWWIFAYGWCGPCSTELRLKDRWQVRHMTSSFWGPVFCWGVFKVGHSPKLYTCMCNYIYIYIKLYIHNYIYIFIYTHSIHIIIHYTGDTIHGTPHIYPYPGVRYHFMNLNLWFEQQTNAGFTK